MNLAIFPIFASIKFGFFSLSRTKDVLARCEFAGRLAIFKINLICFKILNHLAPDYLVDLIHVYESARYLRSSSDKWRLVIKRYNLKTYGFRSFSVIAPILWNDLPVDIRSIDDVNKFKSKLKTFLFKRVYELS